MPDTVTDTCSPNRQKRRAASKMERDGRSEDAEAPLKGDETHLDRRGLEVVPMLLSDKEAAIWLGLSRATFWRRVADGTFPQPIKIGAATRWRRDELMAALDRMTTAQREAAA